MACMRDNNFTSNGQLPSKNCITLLPDHPLPFGELSISLNLAMFWQELLKSHPSTIPQPTFLPLLLTLNTNIAFDLGHVTNPIYPLYWSDPNSAREKYGASVALKHLLAQWLLPLLRLVFGDCWLMFFTFYALDRWLDKEWAFVARFWEGIEYE